MLAAGVAQKMAMEARRTRIVVVEDEVDYRVALCTSLAAYGHDVVGAFGSVSDALGDLSRARPDVAIMDLMLPGMDGLDGIRLLRRVAPEVKVIVLTAHLDKRQVIECLAAGADGYILKGTRLKDIALSIVDLVEGHAPISPEAARHLVDGIRDKTPTAAHDLTAREREVLALLAEGHSYEDIARALDIGVGTVQTRVKSLYRKLEVSSKAEAVTVAMRAGLLNPS
jgi:DNA-binding NarL/FixJ family response regulator